MTPDEKRLAALASEDASARLKAVLALGVEADPASLEPLIARCAVEPDFFVRETLTWSLVRLPAAVTVPRLVRELGSELPQARSQALHTLSKIKDPTAWPAITRDLLRAADDEVARSAWRAAVVLVPAEEKRALAEELATQFGRGERDMQLSLSRALVALGEEALAPVLEKAAAHGDARVRAHAQAIGRLLRDPNAAFAPDVEEARRAFVLGKESKA